MNDDRELYTYFNDEYDGSLHADIGHRRTREEEEGGGKGEGEGSDDDFEPQKKKRRIEVDSVSAEFEDSVSNVPEVRPGADESIGVDYGSPSGSMPDLSVHRGPGETPGIFHFVTYLS